MTPEVAAAWPNFIVIGAGRCGTTSLHYYLGQHPDVFVSPLKEPNYFAFDPDVEAVQGHGDPPDGDLYPLELYREDVRELETVLHSDLGHWR